MNLLGWAVQILTLALVSESVPYLSGPEDLVLHGGGSGQLTCTGSNVTIWYNAANDSVIIGSSPNLTVSTSGLYYCRAEHGTTLVRSCPADVSVVTFKEPSSSNNTTMSVHRTNDVILSSCQHVHSIPPPIISWMFNNGSLAKRNTFILPSGNLLISELKYNDYLGDYRCVAMNPITKEEWHSPITTLKRAPPSNVGNVVFQDTPVRVTAIVGESAVLECAPAGEIKIYITWTPMPSNSQLYNKEYGGVLRIDDVMLSNEGVYNCSYTWSHENYTANGTRQFHLTVKDHPKISNLSINQTSTTAILSCSYTGYPTPLVMWHTPSGVTTLADGNTLTITSLGPEAAGVYQCYITNDIGCDHREISISIPDDYVTSNSSSIGSTYSSVIDTSVVDFSSSVIIHTPSITATIGPIMTSSISSSSESIGPVLSVMDATSSVPIGSTSSVAMDPSLSISIGPISSVSDAPSSIMSVSPISSLTDASSSVFPSAIVATSPSIGTSDVAIVISHTLSSVVSNMPPTITSSSSSQVSLSSTSSVNIIESSTADHSSVVTDVIASTTTTAIAESSRSTMDVSTATISPTPSPSASSTPSSTSPTPSSTSPTPSSTSLTYSSTSDVAPTTTAVTPTPTGVPVAMVTGIEFTWMGEDVVRVQWDPVTNENILGYKISWDSKMIQLPNPAFTATDVPEFEISLMENVATIYIYIWTYNFAGDGPHTPTSIVRPMTNMKCQNISIFSARVDWTILSPVTQYQVTAHCSRTGKVVTKEVKGDSDGTSSEASLLLESLEYDCIYLITIVPEGYNNYSLQCTFFTAEPAIFIEILKNQSFVNGFIIHWKLYNFENIMADLITMEVQVGSQTWTISDPLKLQEFIDLSITQEGRTVVSVTIMVGNVWTTKKTIVVVIPEEQPTGNDGQSAVEDDEDDNSLTWIFYVVAFGSVVAVVIFVIAAIIILKHVQIRRREFDKVTNHREKIMATFNHENANGRPAVEPPKYIVV